jgi:hypothetical protein
MFETATHGRQIRYELLQNGSARGGAELFDHLIGAGEQPTTSGHAGGLAAKRATQFEI